MRIPTANVLVLGIFLRPLRILLNLFAIENPTAELAQETHSIISTNHDVVYVTLSEARYLQRDGIGPAPASHWRQVVSENDPRQGPGYPWRKGDAIANRFRSNFTSSISIRNAFHVIRLYRQCT